MLNVFMRGTDLRQSCRDRHARIGRDRQWLKKERKFGDMRASVELGNAGASRKKCTVSPSRSSRYAEVPWFENCSYLSEMLYKCLPIIRTSCMAVKLVQCIYS
jgi:hypothetical protein